MADHVEPLKILGELSIYSEWNRKLLKHFKQRKIISFYEKIHFHSIIQVNVLQYSLSEIGRNEKHLKGTAIIQERNDGLNHSDIIYNTTGERIEIRGKEIKTTLLKIYSQNWR